MSSYLDVARFRLLTVMPPEQVDRLESLHPGWLQAQLDDRSAYVDSRLSRRVRVPLAAPYSPTVQGWITRLVTLRAYVHHGVVASDQQMQLVAEDAARAEEELREAASGEISLFDLAPSDQSRDQIQYGGVLSYSEASPYVHKDVQRARGREDDERGGGR